LTVNPAQTNFTFIENDQFYSHEIDLTSTGAGPVQWLGGLFYYNEQYDQPINVNDPNQAQVYTPLTFGFTPAAPNPTGSVYNEYTDLHAKSFDIFGQVDWAIDPEFKLTAGLRDSDDTKTGFETFRVILFDADSIVIGPGTTLGASTFGSNTPAFDATACPTTGPYPGAGPCSINPANGLAYRTLSAHWNAVTGTVNLAWTPDSTTLAYLKYSRGYKEGGFNSGTMAAFPETAPETVDAYEVGYKKTVARDFQINVDGFYYNYYNEQQPLPVQPPTGPISTLIFNIPASESYGGELEALWRPIDDLTLSLNYAYLISKVTSTGGHCFEDTADPLAFAPGANTSGCPGPSGGIQLQNITGQSLAEAPKNKVTFDALYTLHFEPGQLVLTGSAVYKSATYDSPFNRPYNLSPEYTMVNLRAIWKDSADRYSVIAYVSNLFNKVDYDGVYGLATTAPSAAQVIDRVASLTAPRTFGIELQYRFK
jgi:iron complex outermembrane receptor protein